MDIARLAQVSIYTQINEDKRLNNISLKNGFKYR